MSLYLDASVLVALFVVEPRSSDADAGLKDQQLFVSDVAAAEFSSAIARRIRIGDLDVAEGMSLFATFDAWAAKTASTARIDTGDMAGALALVRRLDLSLRMPDAANLAIAQRLGAKMFTFDRKMAAAAAAIGLELLT